MGVATDLQGLAEDAAPYRTRAGRTGVPPLHLGASDVVRRLPILTIVVRPGAWGWRTIDLPAALPNCCPSMRTTSWLRRRPIAHREKIVEHLFRALTDINAEGSAVRRPQTLAELMAVTDSDEATLRDIVDRFRAEGVSFLTPSTMNKGDRAGHPDRHQPRGPDPLLAQDRKQGRRLAAARVPGRTDLGVSSGPGGKFARNKEQVLSPAETEYSDRWLNTLPNKFWAERYGGGWRDVRELMAASREEAKRQRELEIERRREAEREAQEEKERADQQASGRPAAGVSFGCARLGHGAGRDRWRVCVAAATACRSTNASRRATAAARRDAAGARRGAAWPGAGGREAADERAVPVAVDPRRAAGGW